MKSSDPVPPVISGFMTPSGQTVCLCMIVKNEAPVVRRCLASVRSIIDHWLIVDTGSTDGTQDIIRAALADLPGELVERPWRDFGQNRSEALALARPRADYSLIIDADDELLVPPAFAMPKLESDSYVVDISDSSITYQRAQLVANRLPWRYDGVLHEFLACQDARSVGHLPVVMRRNHDGRRRRDSATYGNDAAILARALETESDPFLIARYTFYLAQSYRDCGDKRNAVATYLARADLGFWQEEIFCALLEAARIKEQLGDPDDDVIALYSRAADASPTRAEALHGASRLCRLRNRFEEGYRLAQRGADLRPPAGGLFVETWIYEYGLLDELAVNAYWAGDYRACRDTCDRLLHERQIPDDMKGRVDSNRAFAVEKLQSERVATGMPGRPDSQPAALPSAPPSAESTWSPTRAQGGTELMVEGLRRRMGHALDDVDLNVNLFDPERTDGRPLIVWIHHDIDQPAVEWLRDQSKVFRVDRFVFVSTWQMERFVSQFGLRPDRCVVLRNATDVASDNRSWIARAPLKMAYASAPYRGLSVLLDAWSHLGLTGAELHVWSAHKLYGPRFDDGPYKHLYARARELPSVQYHGIVPHDELRSHLRECHFLTYPSTFAETSCLTAIDAMAAGCRVICPDLGALTETVGTFGRIYPFTADPDAHAQRFAAVLAEEIRNPWNGDPFLAAKQQRSVRSTYDWSVRIQEWRTFLQSLHPANSQGPSVAPRSLPASNPVADALVRLRDRGFHPTGLIDVGAYEGHFSRLARHVFEDAHILMVDALDENAALLAATCREIGNATYEIAMLGDRETAATSFFVADTDTRPDLVKTGSSKFRENSAFPMTERKLRQRRLACLVADDGSPFQMVKLDVQGAELEVLRGLDHHLTKVEVILMEMSVVDYNQGAPGIAAVLQELGAMGFVLSDLVEEHRGPDGGLLQVDGLFVRPDSKLRLQPPFWR